MDPATAAAHRLRRTSAGIRVATSALLGLVAGLLTSLATSWQAATLVGWDLASLSLMAAIWLAVGGMDPDETRSHAGREDPSIRLSELIVLIAGVAVLAAVGLALVRAGSTTGATKAYLISLGVVSVALSWALVHTVFTLRYARTYYASPAGGASSPASGASSPASGASSPASGASSPASGASSPASGAGAHAGGIDFNEPDPPTYLDFAYLALTIGMTFQVSDTNLTAKPIRRIALTHALISYLFGAVIVALVINVVSSLLH